MSTSPVPPSTPNSIQKANIPGKKMDVIFETINVPQIKNLFEALKETILVILLNSFMLFFK